MINKHKIMQEYISTYLDDAYLTFQSIQMFPGARAMVPDYGERIIEKDVLGYDRKEYNFVFVGAEALDTGTNTNNAEIQDKFDEFNNWIEEQELKGNYPDFGKNVTEYELKPLYNMSNLALVDEQGIAKYMLGCRLRYTEKEMQE